VTFSDRPFSQRFGAMGDEAEAIFESVYPQGWARYGLNRPPINLSNVPAFVRFTPDYVTAKSLVEVQGFGRDQTMKLKFSKLDALRQWNDLFRTDLFLWDSHHKRYGFVRMADLESAFFHHGVNGAFDNGVNPFVSLKFDHIPVSAGWVTV
jgi:hypothetical protein